MSSSKVLQPLFIACLIGSLIGLSGCDQTDTPAAQQQAAQALPVKVSEMQPQSIYLSNDLPGRVTPYRLAQVRPQVSGIVRERLFEEGSDVEKGDVLYQIEPSTYQAAVNNAKAQLAKAQADEALARKTKNRYATLVTRKVLSQQEFDNAQGEWQQAVAAVKVAQATLEAAQIDLNYTKVRAPISGRIGISQITEGALVTNGQANYLTTIQQLDPIYVDMTQASNQMSGILIDQNNAPSVSVKLSNGKDYAHQGKIAFSDISVDQTTGSQTIRALMPNPEHKLLPGMYVRAKFDNTQALQAFLIPQESVQRDTLGKAFVYLVDNNNKVVKKSVELGEQYNQDWIVLSGLEQGDKVIRSNLLKVKPDMMVKAEVVLENAAKEKTTAEVTTGSSESAAPQADTPAQQVEG